MGAFNKQLPDTITLIANALRAGSSFLQAIELVVRETRPPISTEFARVIREVNLGLPFEQALENMVRRVRSDDLELMATAIAIQHQVGGNLAEILDSIAYTIRERIRIKGEIRTLTAQQRLSGYVVAGLPIGLAGFLFVGAPGFMDPMFDPRASIIGLPAGVIILGDRRRNDVHRLHGHPQDRGHRGLGFMPILPIIIAAVAAGAILLIVFALTSSSPVDPVQARLTQLGSMQAKNLEELELQPPFIERTLRPLVARLSGIGVARSPARRSRNGPRSAWPWPATRATCASPTGSGSRPSAPSSARILFFFLFVVVGVIGLPVPFTSAWRPGRRAVRLHRPGVLARWPGQEAPARDPADDPGRARPADDFRPGRVSASTPRSARSSRSSRDRCPTSSAGRWPRSVSASSAERPCATSWRAPRSDR